MPEHSYGWLSLLPPLLAIGLAVSTRRVLLSLLAGVALACLILADGSLLPAAVALGETHLWGVLADDDHLRVFAFTLAMGAMVGVIHHAGGMQAVVHRLMPFARGRRGGQLVVWFLGLLIFFDDYANTLLLGNTMRPLCDRLRISREKLAYLVDSTAAPVAGLAMISTWVASEIGFIDKGMSELEFSGSASGMSVFLASIPYRFYVLWALVLVPLVAVTLVLVPLVAVMKRDFGPMLAAERRAVAADKSADSKPTKATAGKDPAGHWSLAVVPVLLVVLVVLGLLWSTGRRAMEEAGGTEGSWIEVFNQGDSYVALLYGSLSGLGAALLMTLAAGKLPWAEILRSALGGAEATLPALAILWLAWALAGITGMGYLNTGGYLGGLIQDSVAPVWLPTIVFLLASGVAFATGTSWGTMGLLVPLVIETTHAALAVSGSAVSVDDPIFLAAVGSVLAGAVFGDHCSPISDTTVLSSQSSGCDHIAHVRTQLPYALLVAVVSIVCGTLPAAMGVPPWLLWPLGVAAMAAFLWWWGRPVETA